MLAVTQLTQFTFDPTFKCAFNDQMLWNAATHHYKQSSISGQKAYIIKISSANDCFCYKEESECILLYIRVHRMCCGEERWLLIEICSRKVHSVPLTLSLGSVCIKCDTLVCVITVEAHFKHKPWRLLEATSQLGRPRSHSDQRQSSVWSCRLWRDADGWSWATRRGGLGMGWDEKRWWRERNRQIHVYLCVGKLNSNRIEGPFMG